MKRLITAAFAVILSLGALAQEVSSYDLVVYGGTSSGVIAACTAAREGLSVALIERTGHVGGLTTSGIGNVDIGWATTVGGYTAEVLRSVGAHYGTPHRMQISLECKIAEREFNRMLSESGVDVIYHSRLREQDGVSCSGGKIVSVTMEDGRVFSAPVFIDASYEGDLMARAGVSYIVGRESQDEYGESSAGVCKYRVFRVYEPDELAIVRRMAAKFPLDFVFSERDVVGGADNKTQAYVYRLTVTDRAENMVPFSKPEG